MNIEECIKLVYSAGYSDRHRENAYEPLASEIVCQAIEDMKVISSSALEILTLFKDYYPSDEYTRMAERLRHSLGKSTGT